MTNGVRFHGMAFDSMNWRNSTERNCGPLSDTNPTGMPCLANSVLRVLIVAVLVVLFISKISGNFEYASTTMRIIAW